jgi:hypothetical protein
MTVFITYNDDRPDFRVCIWILRLMSIWKRFSIIKVFSIDSQTIFTHKFLVRIKNLVFIKLNIANRDDLAILKDLNVINVIILIANEIADMCLWPDFVNHSVLICQNLVSDRIDSTAISVEVCSVWLIHQIGHVLIVGSKPFQQRLL